MELNTVNSTSGLDRNKARFCVNSTCLGVDQIENGRQTILILTLSELFSGKCFVKGARLCGDLISKIAVCCDCVLNLFPGGQDRRHIVEAGDASLCLSGFDICVECATIEERCGQRAGKACRQIGRVDQIGEIVIRRGERRGK